MGNSGAKQHPKRLLSSGFTLAVTIGGIIGLGILRTPGEVASLSPDPIGFLTLRLPGGLFAGMGIFHAFSDSFRD